MIQLWTEKHRPHTLDEYVWRDPEMRLTVKEWLDQGSLPGLLFSGPPGCGKTSLILLMLRVLDIPDEDILFIPASRERKIDDLQEKIIGFINAWAFNPSGLKYIVLDEADKLSHLSQGLLRTEIETYSNSSRFLFSCNYPNKIIPALHSRLQEIKFGALEADDFLLRIADILVQEEVVFQPELLVLYMERTYPDLRKCIGMLQQNTRNGTLNAPKADETAAKDYLLTALDLFKHGKYLEGRKLIIEQADPEEYDQLYRTLYQNLDVFGGSQDQQDEALLAIRRAIVHDSTVSDREINVAACLAELTQIMRPPV